MKYEGICNVTITVSDPVWFHMNGIKTSNNKAKDKVMYVHKPSHPLSYENLSIHLIPVQMILPLCGSLLLIEAKMLLR